jgi:hypothetical protein
MAAAIETGRRTASDGGEGERGDGGSPLDTIREDYERLRRLGVRLGIFLASREGMAARGGGAPETWEAAFGAYCEHMQALQALGDQLTGPASLGAAPWMETLAA